METLLPHVPIKIHVMELVLVSLIMHHQVLLVALQHMDHGVLVDDTLVHVIRLVPEQEL